MQSLNRQPSEELDYEKEEEKLKNMKYPGLHLLKQKLKYDNEYEDRETENNNNSDINRKEESVGTFRDPE